jgi:L-histidine Nalpha-methyltransferase
MTRAALNRTTPYVLRDAGALRRAVHRGLSRSHKSLPPWLFYDATGSLLYERITGLPEYYPSRVERSILEDNSEAIVALAARGARKLHVLELGAGTATKSELVLAATVRRCGPVVYRPCDISPEPLAAARARIEREHPHVTVRPVVGPHEAAISALAVMEERPLVMFLGSSIGNYENEDAIELLSGIARAMPAGGKLLLGTDLRKDESILRSAYDDAAGVTAAFNVNVLARINRELGGRFDLRRFRHVAVWNAQASRVEMHLESTMDQVVRIDGLQMAVAFARGERIHTESSVKYDDGAVDDLLRAAGLERVRSFRDVAQLFAVHLAQKWSHCG